jgi:hypothetical protein
MSFGMLQVEDFIRRPMEVVSDIGYLLVEMVERVAYDTPPRLARSTSNLD